MTDTSPAIEDVATPASKGDAVRANVAAIADIVAPHGITLVRATYAGSGDSGDMFDVSVEPEGLALPAAMLKLWAVDYDGTVRSVEKPLDDAIAYTVDLAIECAGHSGYENNSGGGGDFVIDVATLCACLDHYDIVEEHDESSHEFDPDPQAVARRERRTADALQALQMAVDAIA